MELKETTLTITKIEDAYDKQGYFYLKCKGYNTYTYKNKDNKRRIAYNMFTSIRLYPRNQEQADETKKRLWEQDKTKPKIKIVTETTHLYTNLVNKIILVILQVDKYDFETKKMFRKKKNKKVEDDE